MVLANYSECLNVSGLLHAGHQVGKCRLVLSMLGERMGYHILVSVMLLMNMRGSAVGKMKVCGSAILESGSSAISG